LEEEKIREKRQEIYTDIISFPLIIGRRTQFKSNSQNGNNNNHFSQSAAPSPAPQLDDYNSDTNSYHNNHNSNKYSGYGDTKSEDDFNEYTKTKNLNQDLMFLTNCNELKSASTSSLANNSALNNSNSNSNSYSNQNHSLNNSNRTRAMTTYESESSQQLMSHQHLLHNHPIQYPNQYNNTNEFQTLNNKQFNSYRSNHIAPSVEALSSSHSNDYNKQQFNLINKNRQLCSPSPTQLINSMVPLSLMSNNTNNQFNQQQQHYHSTSSIDNIPISLPQRDINYLIHK
jgi:hypothetical protein